MLPGAALGSLAARFCWQGQHFRLWTVPERVSGPCQAQHLGASRLVSAGRGSTSRLWTPERVSGPPPLMLPGEPRGSFLLAGAALQALDGTRARFGAPPLAFGSLAARFCWQGQHFRLWTVPERVSGPCCRRSTWEPRGSFLLAGAALQALDGTRARFGASLDAARRSTWFGPPPP